MRIEDLRTPCLLLDRDRLEANIGRVGDQAARLGVRLRPHFKTPKSLQILDIMMDAGRSRGVTVSTLYEAERLTQAGYKDLLLTTPVAPQKLDAVLALASAGAELTVTLDSFAAADAVAGAADRRKAAINGVIEINVDDYRGGIALESSEFDCTIGRLKSTRGINLRGVLVYPGASGRLRTQTARAELGERHRITALNACAALEIEGFDSEIRSFGSTSVLMAMTKLAGMTEHRGGIFAFQDLHQAGLGWCRRDDISLTVAATIVSHDVARNRLVIDAGGLALSKDRSTAGADFDAQYGWVVDPHTGEQLLDLWVEQVFQEHGVVTSAGSHAIPFSHYPVGRIVAIQVNHADMTAAAYEHYNVVRRGEVIGRFDRINGW